MQWYDWLIVVVPVVFTLGMGVYTRRYLKDVTTFLSAGRVCGRYVISVGDIASSLSIIGLVSYVEIHYKTGFALSYWWAITLPIGVIMGLFGYCMYRFRETQSQSIGQFFEMRYSRKFRIFAAMLRSLSEILANMIMPALAARFFIYFLGLPSHFQICGWTISTFHFIIVLVLTVAIGIICLGGSLAIIVTDTIQGFLCYPMLVFFILFMLIKFSWSEHIMPIMSDRAADESFLNPYDIENLREFNLFFLLVTIVVSFMHRASWTGAGGSSSAARSPHEQKMASLLGTWRQAIGAVFYVIIAIAIFTMLNHKNFATEAHNIRLELTSRVAHEVVDDVTLRNEVIENISKMPVQIHNIGSDKPLSDKENLDTRYLAAGKEILTNEKLNSADLGKGNAMFQEFRSLYYQLLMPVTLRNMLPNGLLGLFCVLMILMMISTDDSRIFSAAITLSQDVILPLRKKQLTPREHMWMIRWVAIGIGIFFFIGSSFMAQLDYIQLYVTLVATMWLGGCGPVIVFGLYSKKGNTAGAWASLVGGMILALSGALVQRNWAAVIYPWLEKYNWTDAIGSFLEAVSRPFNPYIVWKMNAIKCPINSYEWYFITMMTSLLLYWAVSYLTHKEDFNLERMLHRGKYSLDGKREITSVWSWNNLYNKLIGITPEYSKIDRIIAWSYFCYSIVYRFGLTFILPIIWNIYAPWPLAWWGIYFLIVFLIVPGSMAAFTAIWFGICGIIDLRRMFNDLEKRVSNPLDDGRVEGNVSLADKKELEAVDKIEQK